MLIGNVSADGGKSTMETDQRSMGLISREEMRRRMSAADRVITNRRLRGVKVYEIIEE